jgi:hypothetical protein
MILLSGAGLAGGQQQNACRTASEQVAAKISTDNACSIDESRIDALAREWVGVRLNICREAKSFYDDGYALNIEKTDLRAARDRVCAASRTSIIPKRDAPMTSISRLKDPSMYEVPRFFSDEVNRIWLDSRENQIPLSGRFLYKGRPLKATEVYDVALNAFLALAKSRGIAQTSITRALFEGGLNPHWEDLTMVYQALYKLASIGNGPTPLQAVDLKWNQMFGSIADISHVRTIVDGQWMEVSGQDIGKRLKQRWSSTQSVESLLDRVSAYTYFDLQDGAVRVTGFQRDYHLLRAWSQNSKIAENEEIEENNQQLEHETFRSSKTSVPLLVNDRLIQALAALALIHAASDDNKSHLSSEAHNCWKGGHLVGNLCYHDPYECAMIDFNCMIPYEPM